jgi:hypothetical protein
LQWRAVVEEKAFTTEGTEVTENNSHVHSLTWVLASIITSLRVQSFTAFFFAVSSPFEFFSGSAFSVSSVVNVVVVFESATRIARTTFFLPNLPKAPRKCYTHRETAAMPVLGGACARMGFEKTWKAI